jgi:hypothetical protein
MSGKQMEGNNRYRRKQAREARKRAHQPAEEGVTLGASKQRRHLEDDEDHVEKIESIHRSKQHLSGGAKPEPRPRTRHRRR